MTRVYLTEPGSTAHVRGGRLFVEKEGQQLALLPLERVEQVVVIGKGVQLSTALLVELLSRGVGVAYLSRAGRYYGNLSGAAGSGVPLRAAQYACLGNPATAAAFVRGLLAHKLAGQADHLRLYPDTRDAAARLDRLAQQVAVAADIDQARGFEGAAAAIYWQCLVPLLPAAWRFRGRRHHPPPDPINAMLSFGYALLLQELVAAVHLAGFDLQFGALHPPEGSRPSLALDLQEPLRPLAVDRWLIPAVREGAFAPAHFHADGDRVLLTPAGRRLFLTHYEQHLATPAVRHPLAPGRISLRQALDLHVRLVARAFTGGAALEAPRWL